MPYLRTQAKGKVERPYRWLRPVLHEEVHRYNYHQVHSTTREVPAIRFDNVNKAGNSLFRPFALPKTV